MFRLCYLRRKQTVTPYPPHLKNVTALLCKMHKFFIWLKVCCIPPNVGGSEKSRLWLGISGSEKNRGDFAVFRPQGRHDALIVAKLSTSEETKNPLRRAKFQVGRSIYGISGGPWRKNYEPDSKKLRGAKMRRASSMRVHSLMEIGERTTTGDEKQWCFLFVFLLVCRALDVQERGPDVQQRIMSPRRSLRLACSTSSARDGKYLHPFMDVIS